jgi:hypothetical protein
MANLLFPVDCADHQTLEGFAFGFAASKKRIGFTLSKDS